jgi:hypothetical protein
MGGGRWAKVAARGVGSLEVAVPRFVQLEYLLASMANS